MEIVLHDTSYQGGGGVFIGEYLESITITFKNCTFQDNVAHTQYYDYLYTDDHGQAIVGYGAGGGATIISREGLSDIHVTFSWCKFERNVAFKGGGLAAGIETSNITVTVENSVFKENGCNSSAGNNKNIMTASGGGININFEFKKSTFHSNNKFIIQNVTFVNNCALFGGGLYFYSEREVAMKEAFRNTVEIENCTFDGNHAHTGSAVDITPNVFQRFALIKGTLTTPVFKNCTFVNNTVQLNNGTDAEKVHITYGIGTLYISLYNVKFEGNNTFKNNAGTAIHIVNGNIDMSQSSAYFYNNSGIQGGAIALIGQSSMIVGPNRNYYFVNNTAYVKGGGLYVQLDDNHDITASKSCFIQYSNSDGRKTTPGRDWTATIEFQENRALAGTGHAIFATSLYPCQSINDGSLENPTFVSINSSEVFSKRRINILNESALEGAQIATEGARLEPKSASLRVIPGKRFAHEVNITDDLLKEANVTLIASIIDSNSSIRIDKAFSSCVGEQLVLKGNPNDRTTLRLQTTTSRLSYTSLDITLLECPPGFMHSEELSECICDHDKYDGLTECNTTDFTTSIIPGYWAGKVPDENNKSKRELVIGYCPLNFCNYKQGENASGSEIKLPQDYDDWNEAICGESRTGIICGSCAPGHTTHFHSPNFECKKMNDALCKLGWLIYILSELIPTTVVFITLLVFNISFTSGAINGFILFSQILISLNIDASGFITPTSAVAGFLKAHHFIYGLFNLDFFYAENFSFCLWPGASALDMLAFKYVTIVYVLILMIPVILFINKCHRGKRYLAKFCRFTTLKVSVIHGISAFFILCYSQCLNVSLKLLRFYPLTTKEGSNLTVYNRVWLNGNIVYFSRKHLPYALPALFCLLTVGLFPLVFLLVYPLLCKVLSWIGYGESKLMNFIKLPYNKMKPLLDSFQSCFSNNCRFFAGIYFLYRWLPLFLNTVISRHHVLYTTVEAGIVIIMALHALFQPYAKKVHNIIDTLLFADLALINAITLAHYYIFRTALSRQKAVEYVNKTMVVQLVLIYLPLLVMLGYALLLAYRFISGKKYPSKKFESLFYKLSSNNTNDDGSDLPHRLVAGDIDYKSFEDTEGITACDETDLDVTY